MFCLTNALNFVHTTHEKSPRYKYLKSFHTQNLRCISSNKYQNHGMGLRQNLSPEANLNQQWQITRIILYTNRPDSPVLELHMTFRFKTIYIYIKNDITKSENKIYGEKLLIWKQNQKACWKYSLVLYLKEVLLVPSQFLQTDIEVYHVTLCVLLSSRGY